MIYNRKTPIIRGVIEDFSSLSKIKKITFLLVYTLVLFLSLWFKMLMLVFFVYYTLNLAIRMGTKSEMLSQSTEDDDDLLALFSEYTRTDKIIEVLLKNLYKKSKKHAFIRLWAMLDRKKILNHTILEKILFKYLLKINYDLTKDILKILRNIKELNKNKTLKVAIISKLKELLKELTILSLENHEELNNFKIIIDGWKIRTENF